MNLVFVDTSGWAACADGGDPAHAAALQCRDQLLHDGRRLVLTDYIADETLSWLRFRLGPTAAGSWWRQVNESRRVAWARIGVERFERAKDYMFRHEDKRYSFTDCTSFIVMRDLGLDLALTTDHHFEQAGFQRLPPA